MPLPSLIDEVNRLFDELVRDPWRHPVPVRSPRLTEHPGGPTGTQWDVEIPVPAGPAGDLSVEVDGGQLTVRLVRHVKQDSPGESGARLRQEELFQQSFSVPQGTEVKAIRARFDPDRIRVRVRLAQSR